MDQSKESSPPSYTEVQNSEDAQSSSSISGVGTESLTEITDKSKSNPMQTPSCSNPMDTKHGSSETKGYEYSGYSEEPPSYASAISNDNSSIQESQESSNTSDSLSY